MVSHASETKTKIVCTIGPASSDRETLRALIGAGIEVAVETDRLIRARQILDPHIAFTPVKMPSPVPQACLNCEFFDGKKCCGAETQL